MTIPRSLAGIFGFMMFVGFLVSQIYPSQQDTTQEFTDSMIKNFESADVSIFGGLDFITAVWSGIVLMISYIGAFLGYSTLLPSQFYIIFAIVTVWVVLLVISILRGIAVIT